MGRFMPMAVRCRMRAAEGGIVPGRDQAVTALQHATPGTPGSTAFHFDPAICDAIGDRRSIERSVQRPTSATGAFVVPGAARSSEVSGAGQWQSLYLLLSGRKVRALLLERDWMFNADASREARG